MYQTHYNAVYENLQLRYASSRIGIQVLPVLGKLVAASLIQTIYN